MIIVLDTQRRPDPTSPIHFSVVCSCKKYICINLHNFNFLNGLFSVSGTKSGDQPSASLSFAGLFWHYLALFGDRNKIQFCHTDIPLKPLCFIFVRLHFRIDLGENLCHFTQNFGLQMQLPNQFAPPGGLYPDTPPIHIQKQLTYFVVF